MIEKIPENISNNNSRDLTPNFGNKNEISGSNGRDLTPNFGNREITGANGRDLTPNIENKNENIIENKAEGCRREKEVENELKEKYPENKGYKIESETYLRNKDGNIVKDDKTGEARRIDFVVLKDGKVVDSVEVTSKTADKTEQSAKEDRIRENGGNYIKDSNGDLIEIPKDVHTRIERRD